MFSVVFVVVSSKFSTGGTRVGGSGGGVCIGRELFSDVVCTMRLTINGKTFDKHI